MRNRIAAIIGVVVFMILAGTGVGFALWASNAQSTGNVKAGTLTANCAAPTKLLNGGFENPNINPDAYRLIASPFIQGWTPVNDNYIEVWRGAAGGNVPEGAQIVELNATAPATLYQVVSTTPGQTLTWSLKHKGRYGPDTMAVSINANGAALQEQSRFTTGNSAWATYQGVYVVPAGQTSTRISLVSISTTSEAGQNNASFSGNFIDDVTFGTGPCLTSTATITNVTTGGSTFSAGNVVEYTTTLNNTGGAHSTSSVFTTTIPAGLTYVPGSITINGTARTDAAGDDQAEISGTAITARLGQGATTSAGGSIAPDNNVVVKFRATIQASAAGGNLVYNSSTSYRDSLAPTWPLAVASQTITTPVSGSADVAVAVRTLPQLGASSPNQARSWVMRVTNNGPSTATGVSVAVSVPDTMTSRGVTATSGSCTTVTNNASTCTIGSMASGATVDITYTGTMPANPMNQYVVTVTASSTSNDPVPGNNSATGSVQFDNEPPQPINQFSATRASDSQVNLTWQSTNDNVAIAGYRIYRNGVLVTTTTGTGTTYLDTGLTTAKPYWYWVVAVDTAGNVSGQSNGDGAVTYSTTAKYWVQMASSTSSCIAAAGNADNQSIAIQNCSVSAQSLQQWSFITQSGNAVDDNVYVKFANGADRRWSVADGNNSTVLRTSTAELANNTTQWRLGAYWDGTNAHVEIRRTSVNNMCLDVQNGLTAPGTLVQQYGCYGGAPQRFVLAPQ